MKKTNLFLAFTILLISNINPAYAIDTFAKVAKERPVNLNVKTDVRSASRALQAAYIVDNSIIPLNKIHSWTIQLSHNYKRSLKGAEIAVSVTMPEHLHGMTTKPIIRKGIKEGEFFIEGMNFHMPGWWQITLDVDGYGSRDLIRFNAIVGETSLNKHTHHEHH